jgi:hypothetical protein
MQNNLQTAETPPQRAEMRQIKSRPLPPEGGPGEDWPQTPHDMGVAFQTPSARKDMVTEDSIEDNEGISKLSLPELQKKYWQLEQRLREMDIQCSDLVEEITSLRAKNFLDDYSVLKDNFKTLDFSIRSWCIRLREHKTSANESMSLAYPFSNDKALFSFTAQADELYFLISAMWTWLIRLVFEGATDMRTEDPDLWVDEHSSRAMRHFEKKFLAKGEIFSRAKYAISD